MLTAPAVPPERKPLIILCVIAALLLMYATLWPFNPFPHNDVSWLPDVNGIRFGGTVTLEAGDTYVLNGTRHRWSNPGDVHAVIAVTFVGANHERVD